MLAVLVFGCYIDSKILRVEDCRNPHREVAIVIDEKNSHGFSDIRSGPLLTDAERIGSACDLRSVRVAMWRYKRR